MVNSVFVNIEDTMFLPMKTLYLISFLIIALSVQFKVIGQERKVDGIISPTLFNRDNLSGNTAINYSLQLREEGNLQKLLIAPFLFKPLLKYRALNETRFNIVQQNGTTTLGLGVGGTVFSKTKNQEKSELIQYNIIGGLNISLFDDWGSPSRDNNQDSLSDNHYSVASQTYTLGITGHTNRVGVHLSGYYEKRRETAVEGTQQVDLVGYALSFAKQQIKIQTPYKFKPSIDYGFSIEQLFAIENQSELSNGNAYELSVAPHLTVNFTDFSRLRFSLPFHVVEGNQDERGFGPLFQLSLFI